MRINGLIWRVKLYPCGNNSAKGEFVSIFLELTDGLGIMDKNVYFYKIELINYEGKKNFVQEYSSEFANGESWGYSKFFRLDRLEKEGFIDKNGKIGIKVYIRPQNYECLVRDLKNYIDVLESRIEGNDKEDKEEDDMKGNWSYQKDVVLKESLEMDSKEYKKKLIKSKSEIIKKDKLKYREMFELEGNEEVKKKEAIKQNGRNEINQIGISNKNHNQAVSNIINTFSNNINNNNNEFRLLTQDSNKELMNSNNKKEDNFNMFKPFGNNKQQKAKQNAFQIDLSLDDDFNLDKNNEVKQDLKLNNGYIIPKSKDNETFSDDSYSYIMDSLKYIDEQSKQKNKEKDKTDVNPYRNQFYPGNSTSSNRYKYLNSGSNPFLINSNSKVNDFKKNLFD